ncbi:hypothetical protein HGA88_07015 [Candidatus Roizmanbacteria bacterium]|nr:hypothetical protein [Candidatus Roizmanbacteria bacterium]
MELLQPPPQHETEDILPIVNIMEPHEHLNTGTEIFNMVQDMRRTLATEDLTDSNPDLANWKNYLIQNGCRVSFPQKDKSPRLDGLTVAIDFYNHDEIDRVKKVSSSQQNTPSTQFRPEEEEITIDKGFALTLTNTGKNVEYMLNTWKNRWEPINGLLDVKATKETQEVLAFILKLRNAHRVELKLDDFLEIL